MPRSTCFSRLATTCTDSLVSAWSGPAPPSSAVRTRTGDRCTSRSARPTLPTPGHAAQLARALPADQRSWSALTALVAAVAMYSLSTSRPVAQPPARNSRFGAAISSGTRSAAGQSAAGRTRPLDHVDAAPQNRRNLQRNRATVATATPPHRACSTSYTNRPCIAPVGSCCGDVPDGRERRVAEQVLLRAPACSVVVGNNGVRADVVGQLAAPCTVASPRRPPCCCGIRFAGSQQPPDAGGRAAGHVRLGRRPAKRVLTLRAAFETGDDDAALPARAATCYWPMHEQTQHASVNPDCVRRQRRAGPAHDAPPAPVRWPWVHPTPQ